jgi:hypothetical protein
LPTPWLPTRICVGRHWQLPAYTLPKGEKIVPEPKITRTSVNVAARLGQVGAPSIPAGWPLAFRRFFRFTVDMARRFSKNLLKDRTEELVKRVERELGEKKK